VWNGSAYVRIDDGAGNINTKNVVYDTNKDGIIDATKIANLTRSKITDFFASPFWSNIPDKPSTFPPEPHNHDDRYYTKSQLQTSGQAQVHWNNITNKPSTYPPSSHTHSRSDITDFFSAPFWDNIPDKPAIPLPFYSTTDDLSDVIFHNAGGTGTVRLFGISSPTELLGGIVLFSYGDITYKISYYIDGWATTININADVYTYSTYKMTPAYIVPIKADSSLYVDMSAGSYYSAGHAVTKCPFLDVKKPTLLLDVDNKTGEILATHFSNRMFDESHFDPPAGAKHVLLVGDYEISQLPRNVPIRYIRHRNGKFERVKWGYVFRKEVSILGQTHVLWERVFEFDRELSQEEIAQIEQQLGAKFVRVI
jgi:hypothetical protein